MNPLLVLAAYSLVASSAVVVAGYVADDLGVSSRSAMWATVQAVVMFPAVVAVVALWIVVAS
jgi:ABC-type maltose transport system permease subunit